MPGPAVEYLADQLGIGDASCVKKYVHRSQAPYEHAREIRPVRLPVLRRSELRGGVRAVPRRAGVDAR
jgi:hypothetical protein